MQEGRIYGLLGRNGAGKTTTMKMLLGLTKPTSGEVKIWGKSLQGNEKKLLPRIGSLIESPGFYPVSYTHLLTGEQNKERSYTMNKVLIIDDDKELCVLIKRSVLSEDIEADFCNTGKEGLQKLKEKEYQLVILDVMMPGMDVFETLEEIRKENSLPILMFTSKNDSASKVRGLRAGADDYLTKPFDMDELIARIISLIRRYTRFNQTDGMTQQLEMCIRDSSDMYSQIRQRR